MYSSVLSRLGHYSFVLLLSFLFSLLFVSYAEAEEETIRIYSSLGDGTVYTSPYPGTWNNQRDDTVGRAPNYTSTAASVATADSNYAGEYRAIDRAFMSFDTSAIPDNATVTKANLNLYIVTALDDFNDAYSSSLLEGTQVSSSSLVGADIDNCGLLDNPIKGSSDIDVTTVSEEEYLPIDLNPSGLSWISLTSDTKLCMRTGHDIEDSEVVHSGGGNGITWETTRVVFSASEAPGTSTDPYLEITYEIEDEPEPEEDYVLYTQIESPHPSVGETSAWSVEDYAGGYEGWCGSTIGECGCVLTSLVMSARDAGIEEDILEEDVNPSNMNAYLESVNGYTSKGYLRWLAAQAYFGEFTSGGEIASRFYTKLDNPQEGDDIMALIDEKLLAGNHAVLGYKSGHFVWLPEKTDTSYLVNDPWWYETKTADDSEGEDYVRDYDNNFTDTRIIEILTEPVVFSGSDIEVHLEGAAELLFKNELGDMVGYKDGEILLNLDRASYGNTEVISLDNENVDLGRHLLVYEAGEKFTLEVVGVESGEFSLEFFTINEKGEVTTFNYSGYTIPGLVTTLYFDLGTGEIEEGEITLEQFLSILDVELAGYTKQQQKFFKKWAEKVFKTMEEKTLSQALQSIDTYKKLLTAKKIDSPILIDVLEKLGG